MQYHTILTEFKENTLRLTINRPEKMNALNAQVFNELDHVLDYIETHEEIKAAIITGAGHKAFVAGADISEFGKMIKEESMAMAKKGQDIFFKIENCSKPIVAAVNGFALGGGCELAMSCHFRIASDNAKFGQPEVNLGLIPGYGGTQRLAQLIGKGKAMEMLLSGHIIDAAEAKALGLVNYVTSPDTLLKQTEDILEIIKSKAPIAIAGCIKSVNSFYNSHNGYQVEVEEFGNAFNTEDRKEGTAAFLEKRKATFTGK